jgi:hypothetical protein
VKRARSSAGGLANQCSCIAAERAVSNLVLLRNLAQLKEKRE